MLETLNNIDAEAALLGAMFCDNRNIAEVAERVGELDFFEPLHGRIFAAIIDHSSDGRDVTPVTLKPFFEADEAMRGVGGPAYMARLAADGSRLMAPWVLADQVAELAARRRAVAYLVDLSRPIDTAAQELAVAVERATGRHQAIATLDWAALSAIEPKPKPFIVPGLAPEGEVTLFSGPGSAGKSLWAQQVATALAAGVSTLGLDLTQAPAIYLTAEDDDDQLHWRQVAICRALGVPINALANRLHVASLRGRLDNAMGVVDGAGAFALAPAYHRLTRLIERTGARLVALDNVSHLFAGNENARNEVTPFLNALNRLAGQTGAAIILIGHTNKAFVQGNRQGNGSSGSTAWVNAVRSQIVLDHDEDTDIRTVTAAKANYARKGEAMRFVWCDGAFVLERDLPDDTAREIAECAAANSENAAFIACLRARAAQGPDRAVGPNVGPSYVPTQFEGMAEAKGHGKAALKRAMDRLYAIGRIKTEHVKRKGNEMKAIIVEVPA